MNPNQVNFSTPLMDEPRPPTVGQPAAIVPMPREKGAWGILAVSFLLGCAVARSVTWATPLAAALSLLAMLGRRPMANALRARQPRRSDIAWAAALLAGAAALTAVLLALRPDLWPVVAVLVGLLGLDVALVRAGSGRTPWGEAPGIAGLALTSTLAHAASVGALGSAAWGLGLVTVLYFLGSIPFVRGYVRARTARDPGEARERTFPAALYYVLAINAVGGLAALRWLPAFAPFMLLPAALKSLWLCFGRGRLDRRIQAVGYLEVLHSVGFAALAALGFYFG